MNDIFYTFGDIVPLDDGRIRVDIRFHIRPPRKYETLAVFNVLTFLEKGTLTIDEAYAAALTEAKTRFAEIVGAANIRSDADLEDDYYK